MTRDYYIQPDAADPVLSEREVLELAHRHLPELKAVTAVDENGGEARTYKIDEMYLLKIQRPHQLRPRTSLEKEVFFLKQLEGVEGVNVPKVYGYGREGDRIEYTLMSRMSGVAAEFAELEGETRRQVLFAMGAMLRRVHDLPQAPFMESGLFPGDHSPVDIHWRFGNLFDEALELLDKYPGSWKLPLTALEVSRRAMTALPKADQWVALHSNPGPEHVFVDPISGRFIGIIDFGDAYFSHPVLDLRRWRCPADRDAIFAGYIADKPVNENFQQVWRVAQLLTDLVAAARNPEYCEAAQVEIKRLLDLF
jgi:aminoglycoside phosphotransferase (APT) family kinase protein